MPDDKIKISALPSALTYNNTDELVIVQDNGGAKTTKKGTVQGLGSHIAEAMNFSSELDTDSNSLVGAINEVNSAVEDLYLTETTGKDTIATFKSDLEKPLVNLTIDIDYNESGITEVNISHRGSNMCEEVFESGFINASGAETASQVSIRSKNYNVCTPGQEFFAATFSDPACYLMFYDASKTFIERKQANNQKVTASATAHYFRFSCYNYGQGTYDAVNKPVSINLPSSDTTYHAYSNVVKTVDISDYTIYGGTLEITPDGATLTSTKNADGTDKVTPDVYQLSGVTDISTLLGINNIFADTGDVNVSYLNYNFYSKSESDGKFADKILTTNALATKADNSTVTALSGEIEELQDIILCDETLANVSKNASSNSSSTDVELGVTLSSGVEYKVTVKSTIAFPENGNIYFRESSNVGLIGVFQSGNTEQTFLAKPTANCSKIRVGVLNPGSVYTIIVKEPSNKIELIEEELVGLPALYDDKAQFIEYSGEYTESFTFQIPMKSNKYSNMILESYSMYTGNDAPTISASRKCLDTSNAEITYYKTPSFEIGEKGNFKIQQWRIAPFIDDADEFLTVSITIPTGTTLKIKHLINIYDDFIDRVDTGIQLNAHGQCACGAPENTLFAFESASKLGFKYCITIPKVTQDDVLVCFHDDTNIQNKARNDDGSAIAAAYQDRPISDFDYSDLLQFDFGIWKGMPFAGQRLPTLEDFFKVCAKTGMHPMLSVHPSLDGYWSDIKNLAIKYGLLNKLNIKASRAIIVYPMAVLGDDIESYTIDTSLSASEVISSFDTYKTTYGIAKAKCVIEFDYSSISSSKVSDVVAAGYFCGCYNYTNSATTYFERVKTLIEMGVTELTDDYNCSVGLNW